MNKVENWRTIILQAYSVRYALASAVSSLILALYTKDVALIIPAVLSVAVIFARITPQAGITPPEPGRVGQEPPHG